MLRLRLPLAPGCFASLCAAAVLLLPAGCQINLPMNRLLISNPSASRELATGEASSSGVVRTSYRAKAEEPSTGQTLPDADSLLAPLPGTVTAAKEAAVNLDSVLRRTMQDNAAILVARERVNESQIALDAALTSCLPEALRKDTFKKPAAEALVWRRRGELRKVELENLQEAANTYFDWLTAMRGEKVAHELIKHEEKLLTNAQKLAQSIKPVQAIVEAIETAVNGRRQFILHTHQQGEAAAVKLAYLMGSNDGVPTTRETLQPMDRVDTSVPVEVLVRQAQNNGPGVRELQGLIASIQQGIDQARVAQCLCAHTGAVLVCARLQMAQSQLQQAQLSLVNLQIKLRAGVEAAFSAILSGREQIDLAAKAIDHAKETYRIMDSRLPPMEPPADALRHRTYQGVLNSIRQLSQARANYVTAVSNYNKAQARLLLLLGTYTNCPPPVAVGAPPP